MELKPSHPQRQNKIGDDTSSPAERVLHPIQELLHRAGIETPHFPSLRLTFKVPKIAVKMNTIHLAFPNEHKKNESFESLIRVSRVSQSISETHEHEFFIEVEWIFGVESILTDYLHPAFGLVAAEVTCPTCRTQFKCQPQVINPKTIRIECTTCCHSWNITVQEAIHKSKTASILKDLRERRESTLQLIEKWKSDESSAANSRRENYFPFEFQPPVDSQSPIWTASPRMNSLDIEGLLIAFSNQIFLHSMNRSSLAEPTVQTPENTNIEILDKQKKKSNPHRLITLLLTLLLVAATSAAIQTIPPTTEIVSTEPIHDPTSSIQGQSKPIPHSLKGPNLVDRQLNQISTPRKTSPRKLVDSVASSHAIQDTTDADTASYRLYKKAEIQLKLKHYPEAILSFQDLLRRNPKLTELYKNIGFAFYLNSDFTQSAQAFRNFLKFYPHDAEKNEIESFIEAVENHKDSQGLSEQMLGEKWSSLVQKITRIPSAASPLE